MPPISGYFDIPFAENGDLNTIPDATQPSGTVSYNQGFPVLYSTPVASGGYNVPRTAINQVLNDITSAVQDWQRNTIAPFITSTMNGGTPYSYSQYNMVLYGGVAYISLANSNTDTPPSSKWSVVSFRQPLMANTTYYVSTTGNDGNPGTSGSPWATIQHALNYITGSLDLGGYSVTIQLADGTYTTGGSLQKPLVDGGYGSLIINGNGASPSNVVISTTGADCFYAERSAMTIQNMKLQTSSSGNCLNAGIGGTISFSNVIFGTCAGTHVNAIYGGNIFTGSNYAISGSAGEHFLVSNGGVIYVNGGPTITLSGTPAFAGGFVNASQCGTISAGGVVFSGSATGSRYVAALNGVINTGGGGANYFPGNSAGTTATGGQYA